MKKSKFLFATIIILSCNTSTNNNSSTDKKSAAKNEFPESIQTLFIQLQQHPDSAGLRLILANKLDSIGAYKEALAQMDTLLKTDTTNYGLWFTKGQIAEHAKDTSAAMQSYANALHIYQSPDGMLSLANLYAETKNNRALLICKRVKELGIGRDYDAGAAFVEGIYYARTGNKQKALNSFDECIANNYTYMEAYIEKGLVYFDDKQYREALNVFQFASTINTLNADPYYWQGRCYERMNINDSAILRFKQSLSLDKNSPETEAALRRLGE